MLIHIYAVLIPLMLLLAGLFAASEAALFTLTRPQLEGLKETRPLAYRRIRDLLAKPDALLSTFVLGNELLSMTIATLVTSLVAIGLTGDDERVIAVVSVLVSVLLLLTFSEILPKILAFRYPVVTATILVFPLLGAYVVLSPLRKIFLGVSGRLLKAIGIQPAAPTTLEEKDLLTLVEAGAESGSLELEEKDLIVNVFAFGDLTVATVMTPWDKVFRLPDTLTLEDALPVVRRGGFSRIPVVAEGGNDVVGVLYAKELLKLSLAERQSGKPPRVTEAVFAPHVVSSHKKVARLFREFKQKMVHFAVVVDEYGRTLGVVTLEDVLGALLNPKRRRARVTG